MSKTIKQKLEEIWNSHPGVISPNGITEWRKYTPHIKRKKDKGEAEYHGLFATEPGKSAGLYSIRHGDY